MEKQMADIEIVASDGHGIYLPQHVAGSCGAELFPIRNNPKNANQLKECINILMSGPTNNDYWEAWHWVLDNACIKVNRSRWSLYQDGDCWAIPMNKKGRQEAAKLFGWE
jgi:hypothetical protein